jgi:hypothetical protein
MSAGRSILPPMTWSQVHARRLQRHRLADPVSAARPAEVCSSIAGAHAQVMAAAELSVGLRMATGSRSDIRQALWVDRSLIKTFGPRGTVHLLPTSELPMWTGALSSVPAGSDSLSPELRLGDAEMIEIISAMDTAVRDAELTLDELGERVVAATGPWADARVIPAFNEMWPRWRRAIIPAARQGVLCFGPDRGRNVTYTSPRRWLPGFVPADPDAAIADLVRRYLFAYGPATPAQFAQWLAAPKRWATGLFERMGPALTEVDIQGARAWLPSDDLDVSASPPEGIRLLPYFDAYAVGCHPREQLFPGLAAHRALSRGQAGNVPVVLVDGVVAGVWHQRPVGRSLHLRVELFADLDRAQARELSAQVERLGRISGTDIVMTLGPVEAGRHL